MNQDMASTVDHGITKTALKNGIFIGKVSYHYLTDQELEDVQYWLRSKIRFRRYTSFFITHSMPLIFADT